ncbi:inner membrane protein [Flavobacteriaceae bacterium MAR_2010_72]|nr:inner membrane protein [Flavobacteriaceae bacterium MAR_2010_72]
MASIFGHGVLGYTIAKVASPSLKPLIILAIVSAILPDMDVLGFNLGVQYDSPMGHRGFTHSIAFAFIWAVIVTLIWGKLNKQLYFAVIFLSSISHGVLDALTTGGRGVGFLIPFDNTRYFFPYQFIKVSPLGFERFFSDWGLQVILNELKYIVIPCVILLSAILLKNKFVKKR